MPQTKKSLKVFEAGQWIQRGQCEDSFQKSIPPFSVAELRSRHNADVIKKLATNRPEHVVCLERERPLIGLFSKWKEMFQIIN